MQTAAFPIDGVACHKFAVGLSTKSSMASANSAIPAFAKIYHKSCVVLKRIIYIE